MFKASLAETGFVSRQARHQAFGYTPDLLNESDVSWLLASQAIPLLHAVISLQGSE